MGSVYRPQNTYLLSFNKEFDSVMKIITKGIKMCIVTGDYNINLLNYSTNQQTSDFVNDLHANAILPMITRPTRYVSK